ncbi:MAG: hypothetical protein N2234_10770, partial [Planctomycetota bacterium]|nr:hypothetical protein [Planctomycetota bacterium]
SIEGFCYIYLDFQKTWKPYRVLLPYDKIEFCVGEVLKKAVEVGKAIRADSEFKRRGGVVCRSSYSYPCPYLEICTESEVGGERDEFD